MRAAFDDAAVFEHEDDIGVADGGEAVGHDEAGPAGEQLGQGALEAHLGERIDGAGGFIQDHDPRVGQHGAGEADQLAFA